MPQTLNKYSYVANNPIKYVDPTGRVLEISGDNGQDFIDSTFNTLKELSPHISQTKLDNGNVQININANTTTLWNEYFFGDHNQGTKLLSRIIENEHTVTIREQPTIENGNGASAANVPEAYNGVGTNGAVWLVANSNVPLPTYNNETGKVGMEDTPTYIALGHELIHTLHFVEGTYSGSEELVYSALNGKTHVDPKDEVRTVGLNFTQWGDVTENGLREEHGLRLRNDY